MRRRDDQRGSAMVVVLTVLAVLTAYAVINARVLGVLDRELHRIENRQQHGQSSGH